MYGVFLIYVLKFLFAYLLLSVLSLRCCESSSPVAAVRGFSSRSEQPSHCGEREAVASLTASTGSRVSAARASAVAARGLSS